EIWGMSLERRLRRIWNHWYLRWLKVERVYPVKLFSIHRREGYHQNPVTAGTVYYLEVWLLRGLVRLCGGSCFLMNKKKLSRRCFLKYSATPSNQQSNDWAPTPLR